MISEGVRVSLKPSLGEIIIILIIIIMITIIIILIIIFILISPTVSSEL